MTEFVNKKIDKDPDAYLDYAVDWTTWLDAIGDTIASADAVVDNNAVVESVDILGGKIVRVWVSGGDVGTKVALRVRITTTNVPPRVDDRTVYLVVKER